MKTHKVTDVREETETVELYGGPFDGDRAEVPVGAKRVYIPVPAKPSVNPGDARPSSACYVPTSRVKGDDADRKYPVWQYA